jgi:hypothetical protein
LQQGDTGMDGADHAVNHWRFKNTVPSLLDPLQPTVGYLMVNIPAGLRSADPVQSTLQKLNLWMCDFAQMRQQTIFRKKAKILKVVTLNFVFLY